MTPSPMLAVLGLAALAACSDAPTTTTETPSLPDFVLYGTADGNDHPYVGFSLYYVPEEESWFRCSGALLEDGVTFVTAGHCAHGIGDDGRYTWVTFDEHVNLDAFRAATTLEGEIAALEANKSFTQGTSIAHPDYNTGFPNTYDVGVVILDQKVRLSEYAQLAVPGEDDFSKHQLFDIVGYGLQDIQPTQVANLDRIQGQVTLVQVKSGHGYFGPYNLQLSSNNGAPHRGSTCFGDSGGPILIGNTIYAVNSYVWNSNCTNMSYAFRVDLPEIYQWILDQQ